MGKWYENIAEDPGTRSPAQVYFYLKEVVGSFLHANAAYRTKQLCALVLLALDNDASGALQSTVSCGAFVIKIDLIKNRVY